MGIKVQCPYPLSLEGAAMPHAFISIDRYYIECKITPSEQAELNIIHRKAQSSIATFINAQLRDELVFKSHDLTINIKSAGVDMEKIHSAISASIEYANDFYGRKSFTQPFQINASCQYPANLFHSGKFCFLTKSDTHHLPYPSGLEYSLYGTKESLHPQAANDKNAFLLSEAFYKVDYSGMSEITIPKEICNAFENRSDKALSLFPLVETQEVLGIFLNSALRDSFQDKHKNSYIGNTHLNLDGIIVV